MSSGSAATLARAHGLRETIAGYYTLTKPGIVLELLVTTVPAMVLAAGGVPSLWLVFATLFGGSLAAGGAGAVNSYVDRERDGVMLRTQDRPLPRGDVQPRQALVFGLVLGVIAFAWLVATVNLLTAGLAVGAMAFYVVVYTMWLKPSTPQNIVIGGTAGAVPPLCGWAAVTGEVGMPALVMALIIFLWTPPHFWALALRYSDDYARARVPMLPVVKGERETKRQILLYSLVLVASTFLLAPYTGAIYPLAALALGAGFLWMAWQLFRSEGRAGAMRLFGYSITYLTLLFTAVAVDVLVGS